MSDFHDDLLYRACLMKCENTEIKTRRRRNERVDRMKRCKTCSARDRFTLDPESGFVYDRENEEWLTEPGSVFDAMWPLLPNRGSYEILSN